MEGHLGELMNRFSKPGRVEWIGVRPDRKAPMEVLDSVFVAFSGLEGDRRAAPGKRAVTLIQFEHLPVIASLAGRDNVSPELLRRNIVISGINLLGLRNKTFSVGDVVLQGNGLCAPCSRMETQLGDGGYTAMRGHGGITASVIVEGTLSIGDEVAPAD